VAWADVALDSADP